MESETLLLALTLAPAETRAYCGSVCITSDGGL